MNENVAVHNEGYPINLDKIEDYLDDGRSLIDADGWSLAHHIAKASNVEKMEQLKKLVSQEDFMMYLSLGDEAEFTPLHIASSVGKSGVVRYICDHVTNRNPKTTSKRTPLMIASSKNHLSVVKCLLSYLKPDEITSVDTYGRSAIHFACLQGNEEIVQELLSSHYAKNIEDLLTRTVDGCTCLHYTVESGSGDIVLKLLEVQPNLLFRKDLENKTAVDYMDEDIYAAVKRSIEEGKIAKPDSEED